MRPLDGVVRLSPMPPGTDPAMLAKRQVRDISQRMLTPTLRDPRHDGLNQRTIYPTGPSVDHCLTKLGVSLAGPLKHLVEWSDRNHARVRKTWVGVDRSIPGGANDHQ